MQQRNMMSTVIKMANRGSSVVVWDRIDCIKQAEKQLAGVNV